MEYGSDVVLVKGELNGFNAGRLKPVLTKYMALRFGAGLPFAR
jgi:hypothetical protein